MKTSTTTTTNYTCEYCNLVYANEQRCKQCEEECKAKLELSKLEPPKFQPGDIVKVKQGVYDCHDYYKYFEIKDVQADYWTEAYYKYITWQRNLSGHLIQFNDVPKYELVLTNEQRQKAIADFTGYLIGSLGIERSDCEVIFNCKTGKLEATISKDIGL